MQLLLTDLKDLVPCQNVTLFFFDIQNSHLKNKDGVYCHSYLLDGKWIERVGLTEHETADPCFRKSEELGTGLKTREHIAIPFNNREGNLFSCVQITLKTQEHNSRDTFNSNQPNQLSSADEKLIDLAMTIVQTKLDKLNADYDSRVARREVVDSIKLARMICTQRSYSELF